MGGLLLGAGGAVFVSVSAAVLAYSWRDEVVND